MLNDRIFATSIAISLTGHAILFLGLSGTFAPGPGKNAVVETTYYRIKSPSLDEKKAMPAAEVVKAAKKSPAPVKNPTQKITVKHAAEKADNKMPDGSVYINQTDVLKKGEAFIGYNKLIKEKIRDNLRYPTRYPKGDVYLSFLISRDGALKSVNLSKGHIPGEEVLEDISLRAVKDASPFPPFPKALHQKEIRFNLGISFLHKP